MKIRSILLLLLAFSSIPVLAGQGLLDVSYRRLAGKGQVNLAQTYGGDVRAEPSALGGLQLQLQLPLSTPTAAAAA